MIKTLHEALRRFDEEFTPGTTLFSDYVLWTSDNNGGFLRTRFVSKASPLPDRNLEEGTFIILAVDGSIDTDKITYHGDYSTHKLTELKLQFCWMSLSDLEDMLDWNEQLGYKNRYVLNCDTGKVTKIDDLGMDCLE